jgi:hypothetical protein
MSSEEYSVCHPAEVTQFQDLGKVMHARSVLRPRNPLIREYIGKQDGSLLWATEPYIHESALVEAFAGFVEVKAMGEPLFLMGTKIDALQEILNYVCGLPPGMYGDRRPKPFHNFLTKTNQQLALKLLQDMEAGADNPVLDKTIMAGLRRLIGNLHNSNVLHDQFTVFQEKVTAIIGQSKKN